MQDAVSRCDGILLTGGPDLDARHFGEFNLPSNGEISPIRDSCEIFIVRKAVDAGKPVLGICRGAQVINVALGGTIYQDIYSQVKDRELLKHSQQAPKWYPTHDIIIEEGTRLWEAFGEGRTGVNSFHHQAIKEVAPGFIVTSKSDDGIIESIEHQSRGFVVGVQWHPELMWEEDGIHLKLFEAFVNAAAGL